MPTTKDFLVKVKDLPEFDGLKLTPDNKLRIPDATINLGETAGGVATNTLNKDHFNLGSGTTTMLIEPDTFRMIKDIPADVEQETDAEYYKVEIDSVHQTFTIYDTDRITPIFQVTSSGLALGSSIITGITSQGGTSSTLAASQLLVNGKQNTLTAGANIQIVNDVISAVLTEASNIIGTTDPQVGQGSPGVLYLKYEDVPSGSHVDPETGETVTDYTREIVNVYGNISGLWYEFPEGSLNLFGTTPPTADMGDNGSIYMQFNTVDGITQVYGKVNDTWYPFGGGGSVDPAIQKKVDELDETAIRTDAPLYTIDGEPLETISESQLEGRSKNNIEDNVVVTQVQTSGTEIAQVKVGSHTTSIYAPSGGGEDGDGYYKETELYSSTSSNTTITLDDSYLNYDALIFLCKYNSGSYLLDSITSVTGIEAAADANCYFRIYTGSDVAYIFGTVTNETTFSLTQQNYWLTKVIGVNYCKNKIKALIPKMTSNTTPSGTASASSYAGTSFYPYMAFDGANGVANTLYNTWLPLSSESTSWVMYEFDSLKTFEELKICTGGSEQTNNIVFDVEGRKSDNTWENCLKTGSDVTFSFPNASFTNATVELNGNEYNAIRLTSHSKMFQANVYACGIDAIQILGKNVS